MADAVEPVLARLAATHTELVGTLPFDVEDEAIRHVKTLLVANKLDAEGAADRLDVLREWFEPRFPILPISAEGGEGLETLRGLRTIYWECFASTPKSLASRSIERSRSPCPSAARSWTWPGRSIATSSTR